MGMDSESEKIHWEVELREPDACVVVLRQQRSNP